MTKLLNSLLPVICFNAEGAGSGGGEGGGSDGAGSTTLLGGDAPAAGDGNPEGGDSSVENNLYGSGDGAKDGEGDGSEGEPDDKKDGEGDDKKDGDKKEGEGDKPKPEDYDLSVPEGFELDTEVEAEFRQIAAERGWSKEDVSKLKDLQLKLYERQTERHAETISKWGEQLKTDKEIGGPDFQKNSAKAVNAVNEFFSPEAKALLNSTGLGNHPEIVRGFFRIGQIMGEGSTHSGSQTASI